MSEASLTKKALVQALKELGRTRNFEKITVTDITTHCGLNRQTFYYHFVDKYEILNWVYSNETFSPLTNGINLNNWHERLQAMLEIMWADKHFYMNTIRSQEEIFQQTLYNVTRKIFRANIAQLDTEELLAEANREFHASFLAHGICGVILDWIKSDMNLSPAELASKLADLELNVKRIALKHCYPESSDC